MRHKIYEESPSRPRAVAPFWFRIINETPTYNEMRSAIRWSHRKGPRRRAGWPKTRSRFTSIYESFLMSFWGLGHHANQKNTTRRSVASFIDPHSMCGCGTAYKTAFKKTKKKRPPT